MKPDKFLQNNIEKKDSQNILNKFRDALKTGSIVLALTLLTSFAEAQIKDAKVINNTELSSEEKTKRIEEANAELKKIRYIFEEGQQLWNIKKKKNLFNKTNSNFTCLDDDDIIYSDTNSKEKYIAEEDDKDHMMGHCKNLNVGARIEYSVNNKKTNKNTISIYTLDFKDKKPFFAKSVSTADKEILNEKTFYPSEEQLKEIDNQFKILEQKILEEIKIAEAQ